MLFSKQPKHVRVKTEEELQGMRIAGRLAAECLQWICAEVSPGITTQDLDDMQMSFCDKHGVKAAPLGYRGFPKSLCTSINEVICHGIPNSKHVLVEGDVVGVDVTLIVDGFHGDNAATVPVGEIDDNAAKLLNATLESLRLGIEAVGPRRRLGVVGHAIQQYVEPLGYSVVRDFVGHGIGRKFHEEPQVMHAARPSHGPPLRPNMTFTIEPMINEGVFDCRILRDGWTAVTTDGKRSAQFEHTIAVTEHGYEILTVQNDTGAWESPGRVILPN